MRWHACCSDLGLTLSPTLPHPTPLSLNHIPSPNTQTHPMTHPMTQPMAQPMAQPMMQPMMQPQMMSVQVLTIHSPLPTTKVNSFQLMQVPQGVQGGMMVQVQTPGGPMQVQVPQGLMPGQVFHMQMPAAAPQQQMMQKASIILFDSDMIWFRLHRGSFEPSALAM